MEIKKTKEDIRNIVDLIMKSNDRLEVITSSAIKGFLDVMSNISTEHELDKHEEIGFVTRLIYGFAELMFESNLEYVDPSMKEMYSLMMKNALVNAIDEVVHKKLGTCLAHLEKKQNAPTTTTVH